MTRMLFLVECGPESGIGHLRRMLALAKALAAKGADCDFRLSGAGFADMVVAEGHRAGPWIKADADVVDGFDAVMVDSYDYALSLLDGWRGRLLRCVMDDEANRPLEADLLLNHNLYGETCDYGDYRLGKLLAGPRYALLSDAFVALRSAPRPRPPHVLVSFGGSDDGRFAVPAAEALRAMLPDAPLDVALMRSPSPELRARLDALSATVHMAAPLERLMGDVFVYVGAAGFTLLEAVAAGLSPVICSIADNQAPNIPAARALGLQAFNGFEPMQAARAAAKLYGNTLSVDVPGLDGRGAARVADVILAETASAQTMVRRQRSVL